MPRSTPLPEMNTCQICGRPIKLVNGKIALHGYKRPQAGWQTSSCMGARHLPYEQSCDRIASVIESCQVFIEKTEDTMKDFLANPPQTITEQVQQGWKLVTKTDIRPVDFNSAVKPYSPKLYSYADLYFRKVDFYVKAIAGTYRTIAFLRERLDNWKAPAEAVVAAEAPAVVEAPAPAEHASEYHPDCALCLRGLEHTADEHVDAIMRAQEASQP